ncbi:serine/threonine-protein kinase STY8 [Pelomyxa schiedti]|nr:serine/threonine-protein kinase STY8 [Pelomyxa schiedti]
MSGHNEGIGDGVGAVDQDDEDNRGGGGGGGGALGGSEGDGDDEEVVFTMKNDGGSSGDVCCADPRGGTPSSSGSPLDDVVFAPSLLLAGDDDDHSQDDDAEDPGGAAHSTSTSATSSAAAKTPTITSAAAATPTKRGRGVAGVGVGVGVSSASANDGGDGEIVVGVTVNSPSCSIPDPAKILAEHTIPSENLVIGAWIGSGTFAIVYAAAYKGKSVAVKVFNNKASHASLLYEIRVLKELQHENIIGFIGVIQKQNSLSLVMDYCSLGSLFEQLHPQGDKTRKTSVEGMRRFAPRVPKIAIGIASGLHHLHSLGYIHCDLCSSNVLLASDYTPKIADFGQVRREGGVSQQRFGHQNYRAPEMYICLLFSGFSPGHSIGSNKIDLFSYGIVLWELLHAGRTPWEGVTDVEAATLSGFRPAIDSRVSVRWAKIVEACWDQNPHARPPFEDVVVMLKALEGVPFLDQ